MGFNRSLAGGDRPPSDQDADWEVIESDNDRQGTELQDFSKRLKCPLGLVIVD